MKLMKLMQEEKWYWSEKNHIRIFLHSLQTQGIEIYLEEGRLKYKGDKEAITQQVLQKLKNEKVRLIEYLTEKAKAESDCFELTSIQQAYYMGRNDAYELGGISANYYFEVQLKSLEVKKLEKTLNQVIAENDALRTVILESGKQTVLSDVPFYRLEVIQVDTEAEILELREKWKRKMYLLETWPMFLIFLTTHDEKAFKLHMGFDCTVLDAWSVTLMLKQIFGLYEGRQVFFSGYTFKEYCTQLQKNKNQRIDSNASKYWTDRAENIAKAPKLPYKTPLDHIKVPHFHRMSFHFSEKETELLYRKVKEHKCTPAAVVCTAYMKVLSEFAKGNSFTLNLTVFSRLPFHEEVPEILGDFTNISVAEYGCDKNINFQEEVAKTQREFWNLVKFREYDGTEIIRKLQRNSPAEATLPVVFTGILQGLRRQADYLPPWAEEVYSYSQTPQVALDYQATDFRGNLSVNWDYVEEAFEEEQLIKMFDANIRLLRDLMNKEWNTKITVDMGNNDER